MPSMRPNRVKHKLAAGELATGVMGTGMTADLIEWLGPLGFDSVWLEGEHGPLDYRDIPDQSRAADIWGMTSIVRVNENRYGPIYRVLDLGAQGVCVPHVDTREQAQAVADASKFIPVGKRGMTTSRQGYGVSDFYERANDECLAIILIEDILAVNTWTRSCKSKAWTSSTSPPATSARASATSTPPTPRYRPSSTRPSAPSWPQAATPGRWSPPPTSNATSTWASASSPPASTPG